MITQTLYERIQPVLWRYRHVLDGTPCPYCPTDMCASVCRVCGRLCFAEVK